MLKIKAKKLISALNVLKSRRIFLIAIVAFLLLVSTSAYVLSTRISMKPEIKKGVIKIAFPTPSETLTQTKVEELKNDVNNVIIPTTTITPIIKPVVTPTATPIPTSRPTDTAAPAKDTSAPVIDEFGGPEDGSTVSFTNFCFPIHAIDASQPIFIKAKFDSGSWSDWGTDFANCYNNVGTDSHSFSVQLKDNVGNETSVITRNFKVET